MADKLNFQGQYSSKSGSKIDVTVNLVQFKDKGSYVIYAPALEVFGYGKTIQEAKESFNTCLEEFFTYSMNKGTFTSELKQLGWKIKGRKNNRTYKIPGFSELLAKNERLINILDNKDVRTFQTEISMAEPT